MDPEGLGTGLVPPCREPLASERSYLILCLLQLQDQVEPGLQLCQCKSGTAAKVPLMLAQQEEKGLPDPGGLGSHAETHISLWLSTLLLQTQTCTSQRLQPRSRLPAPVLGLQAPGAVGSSSRP